MDMWRWLAIIKRCVGKKKSCFLVLLNFESIAWDWWKTRGTKRKKKESPFPFAGTVDV